jgi:ribulose-5-phosphate 4-epimerase/fuculose-1-phosphate aldolase
MMTAHMTDHTTNTDHNAIRRLVSQGCKVLGAEQLGDLVWGHVSMRDPDGHGVWMKAATLGFEEVTPADVVLVSWEGEVLEGTGRRHAEWPIHTEVMRSRPDVGSVVHVHAPSAIGFAALDTPLRPISHEGTLFVPPDIARFTKTGDLILTPALGADMAHALGDRNAVLLVHHGVVVAEADVPRAVVTTVLLERACRMQLRAMAAGTIASWSSDEEALAKREHCYGEALLRQAWDYLVRCRENQ